MTRPTQPPVPPDLVKTNGAVGFFASEETWQADGQESISPHPCRQCSVKDMALGRCECLRSTYSPQRR